MLEDWSQNCCCKHKELESLIGHLQLTYKVVPQGRSFLRRMINLLCAFRGDDHPIRLNQEFFLDLAWWQEFLQSWNGCSFLQYPKWAPLPDFGVSSDASGALGYGAVFQGHWFSGAWLPTQVSQSIEYKELFPIVWQLTSGVPDGPLNGSTSNQITAQWWKFCGLALQESLPSYPWFAICPCWQLVTPPLSLPPQLKGRLTLSLTSCLAVSFSAFAG